MKNSPLFLFSQLFLLALSQPVAAQRYLPAAITFHSGQTESGEVFYGNWVETPQSFRFMNKAGVEKKYGVNDLRSVEVTRKDGKKEHYECRSVMVNRSPTKLTELETGPVPRMVSDTVFMQTLLLSEVNFYLFKESEAKHFFVEKDSLQELVFKQYLKDPNDFDLMKNNRFRQQLLALTIDCPYLRDQILKISYEEKQIRDVLLEYNKCKKTEITYQYKPEKLKLHVYAGAGVTAASLLEIMNNNGSPYDIIENDPTIRFTPIVGFLFPIRRTNERFQVKTDVSLRGIEYAYGYTTAPESLEEINLIHLRSQTLLQWNIINQKHKLYLQGGVINSWIIGDESELIYGSAGGEYETVQRKYEFGLVGGAGYSFARIGLDVRYDSGNGYTPSAAVTSSVHTISLFLTYRVF